MIVLLPPSERKTPATRGAALDLASLHHPELTPAREQVLTALEEASASCDAAQVLGTGASLVAEVQRNTRWRTEPAQDVRRLYSGVLYDALDLRGLPRGAAARAAASVRVLSAAHGLLAPGDRVPAYRLAMDVDLPGTGPLAAFWREHLTPVLDAMAAEAEQVVVDCRSAAYAAAWRPPRALAERVVAVRVLREQDGRRSVVSHGAKHARGLVARHLLTRRGAAPKDAERLARAVAEAFACELSPAVPGRSRTLDVVVRD
ncbi:YaaA family protein [Quadrisphaera sp. DSM 44207]|uniref:YaaA family protein n=1 Tax=Quadrisphaera sp. DSM 44207 TaxID=1881057 RepID=UPI000B850381|nr:peroxide stress protein YaaA [Quadrisphaera sp. DSM 44207]